MRFSILEKTARKNRSWRPRLASTANPKLSTKACRRIWSCPATRLGFLSGAVSNFGEFLPANTFCRLSFPTDFERTSRVSSHRRLTLRFMNETFDVVVIGAGPTGLACAIEAQKAGLKAVD